MAVLNRVEPLSEPPRPLHRSNLFAAERFVGNPKECFFYHSMDLPEYGLQEGPWDLRGRFSDYIGHVAVEGKRVLDVGSASGFLSFEAERLGAREVVSFDLDSARRQSLLPFAGSEYVTDHAKWCVRQTQGFRTWQNAYWLAHRLLKSRTKVYYGDVYDLPGALGLFDVIIVGAILEHLIDPLSALFSLSRHAGDIIVINTDLLDLPGHFAVFNGREQRPENSFVFWTYSVAVYDEYMRIMGFKPVNRHKDRFPAQKAPDMVERTALVYARDTEIHPVVNPVPERVRR